jgi:hypothetical protein
VKSALALSTYRDSKGKAALTRTVWAALLVTAARREGRGPSALLKCPPPPAQAINIYPSGRYSLTLACARSASSASIERPSRYTVRSPQRINSRSNVDIPPFIIGILSPALFKQRLSQLFIAQLKISFVAAQYC